MVIDRQVDQEECIGMGQEGDGCLQKDTSREAFNYVCLF